jgi:hypothetical protein
VALDNIRISHCGLLVIWDIHGNANGWWTWVLEKSVGRFISYQTKEGTRFNQFRSREGKILLPAYLFLIIDEG